MTRKLLKCAALLIALSLPLGGCLEPAVHSLSERAYSHPELCRLGNPPAATTAAGNCEATISGAQ